MTTPVTATDPDERNSDRVVADLGELIARGERFSTILGDPPWEYDQSPRGAARHHYSTMSLDDLKALPVGELAMTNCHMHLWCTHSFLGEAREVMAAWGFEYRSILLWTKPQLGTGHYWRSSCEFLLLGIRGKLPFRDRSIPNWLCVPRGKHSEKPDIFRKLVELVSHGPRLELFGRKAVPGWTVFGNEVQTTIDTTISNLFSDLR